MAVLAQFGGLGGCLDEDQMRMLREYGVLVPTAAAAVASGGQSELTCNGGAGVFPSRKRGRDAGELDQCYMSASSTELLPIPGMAKQHTFVPRQQSVASSRMVGSGMTSTSGRTAAGPSVADALAAELFRQGAEVDALVRAECERMVAGLEQARKRRCQALVTAVATGAAARALREKEAELAAARRRGLELEERVRQATAESQAWCALARSNEAVAAGLRATLDSVLLRAAAQAAVPAPVEGFGDSETAFAPAVAEDDAQSCCLVAKAEPADTGASSPAGKWGCKGCGEREATVLLLPCRHLCLCKACEPRLDACPVCLAVKNASIHIAAT